MRNPHHRQRYRPYRKANPKPTRPQNEQAIILSGLNVLQVLEDSASHHMQNVLHYGPKTFLGSGAAAALLWYRRKGYGHYQTLKLFGVWVTQTGTSDNMISIGKATRDYSAAIYNAEAYHTLIKQSFMPYYGKDISLPSDDNILFQTPFDVTQRLALRRTLADQLDHWFRHTLFT